MPAATPITAPPAADDRLEPWVFELEAIEVLAVGAACTDELRATIPW